MAFKRLSAVVTVRDGKVIKSYGYAKYRPGGNLSTVLQMLDRWEVDEIYVIDIGLTDSPSTLTLETIRTTEITTPVSYGGGITSVEDAHKVMKSGCERFVIGRAAYRDQNVCESIALRYGAQSVILSLPLSCLNRRLSLPHYLDVETDISRALRVAGSPWISEVFITDWINEGSVGTFDTSILERARIEGKIEKNIIAFGGIDSKQAEVLLSQEGVVAVCIGNKNLEDECFLSVLAKRLRTRIRLRGTLR